MSNRRTTADCDRCGRTFDAPEGYRRVKLCEEREHGEDLCTLRIPHSVAPILFREDLCELCLVELAKLIEQWKTFGERPEPGSITYMRGDDLPPGLHNP